MPNNHISPPAEVVEAFSDLSGDIESRSLAGGLLNQTFEIHAEHGDFILQRVSAVFNTAIHDNIEAVTRHLETKGFATLRLRPTRTGSLVHDLGSGGRWRLMTHLGGKTLLHLESTDQASSAGHLVGRFHAAMNDFEAPLAHSGIDLHDTPSYARAMRRALRDHSTHPMAKDVAVLAAEIFGAIESLGHPPTAPERVIHGDLKLANLLFRTDEHAEPDRAFALIDLDTVMRGPLWMELGDAWRSWCGNAADENAVPEFQLDFFEASLRGFLDGHGPLLDAREAESLMTAPERITLELALRFATDILEESYFAWDAERFSRAAEHNRVRAQRMRQLAEDTIARRADRERLIAALT